VLTQYDVEGGAAVSAELVAHGWTFGFNMAYGELRAGDGGHDLSRGAEI
jgi:hypothetical protein